MHRIQALVDTGSDINLIRRDLVPQQCLVPSRRPMCILAANQMSMGGDHRELQGTLIIRGQASSLCIPNTLEIPVVAYDADIDVDAILSYEWLATQNVDILPRSHGVRINLNQWHLWVPGAGLADAIPSDKSTRRIKKRAGV